MFYGYVNLGGKNLRLRVVGDRGLINMFGPKREKGKIIEKFHKEGPREGHALRSTIPINKIKGNEMGGTFGT
jgi:hypothetical protein